MQLLHKESLTVFCSAGGSSIFSPSIPVYLFAQSLSIPQVTTNDDWNPNNTLMATLFDTFETEVVFGVNVT